MHAAGALGNLARHERCQVLINERDGITPLIELLKGGTEAAKEATAKAITALVDRNRANEKELLEKGAVPLLTDMVRDEDVSINAAPETLSNAALALEALGQQPEQLLALEKARRLEQKAMGIRGLGTPRRTRRDATTGTPKDKTISSAWASPGGETPAGAAAHH